MIYSLRHSPMNQRCDWSLRRKLREHFNFGPRIAQWTNPDPVSGEYMTVACYVCPLAIGEHVVVINDLAVNPMSTQITISVYTWDLTRLGHTVQTVHTPIGKLPRSRRLKYVGLEQQVRYNAETKLYELTGERYLTWLNAKRSVDRPVMVVRDPKRTTVEITWA